MMLEEIDRLAQAVNALRPDWRINSLKTFIANNLANRSYRDAVAAFVWIAADPETRTPSRILNNGPWWPGHEAQTQSSGTGGYGPTCRCGKTRPRHNEAESKVAPELRHEFETDADHEARIRRQQRGSEVVIR